MILIVRDSGEILDLKYAVRIMCDKNCIGIEFSSGGYKTISIEHLKKEEIEQLQAFIAMYKNKETVFVLDDVIKKIKRDRGKDHDD